MPKTFDSWKPIMVATCDALKPKLIVEWGPGMSTEFFAKNTDADIYTWEHDKDYYNKVVSQHKDNPKVHVYYGVFMSADLKMFGKRTPYVAAPLRYVTPNTVDIALVDGRMRSDCLILASYLIREGGVVVLHDANRSYSLGKSMYGFSYYDVDNNTQFFCKSQEVLDVIVPNIKTYAEVQGI